MISRKVEDFFAKKFLREEAGPWLISKVKGFFLQNDRKTDDLDYLHGRERQVALPRWEAFVGAQIVYRDLLFLCLDGFTENPQKLREFTKTSRMHTLNFVCNMI